MGKNENQMVKQACENAVDPKHYTSGTWLQEVGNRGRIKLVGGGGGAITTAATKIIITKSNEQPTMCQCLTHTLILFK